MKGKLIKTTSELGYALVIQPCPISNKLEYLPNLSRKNCEAVANGYDLDDLTEDYCLYKPLTQSEIIGFKNGFQKALEILDEYIKSMQLNEWNVEIVMEYIGTCNGNNNDGCFQNSSGHDCGCYEYKPKLDASGCLILKRL